VQIWRRNLVPGDPSRNWFAAWSAQGLLPDDRFRLLDSRGVALKLEPFRLRPTQWFDERIMCCFRVPNDAPKGTYTLVVAGMPAGNINLVWSSDKAAPPVVGNPALAISAVSPAISPDTLYLNCVFTRASVFSPGGFYLNCEWYGLASPGLGTTHAFSTWGLKGPLALVGCTFDGTDRGPVLNLTDGPIVEPLFYGLTLRNISHVDGGNELFCVEKRQDAPDGAKLIRPILASWKCYCNEGDFYIAGPTEDALIRDVVIDRGNIVAIKDALRGGIIEDCELRRGRIVLGDCDNVTVRRCALLDRRATRGNRTYTQAFYYMADANPTEAAKWNLPQGIAGNGMQWGAKVENCYFAN